MKAKLAAAVLFLAVILSVPACAPAEPGPLRICVDVGPPTSSGASVSETWQLFVEDIMAYAELDGRPFDIELEVISLGDEKRDTAIERIHTEIMAGEGPDVFFIANTNDINANEYGLFPIPEKAMAEGIFLPLDEYMENNSQFTDWDNQIEPIMAAGRTEAGQVVLPFSFRLPVTCFRQSEVPNDIPGDTTWEDMLADESNLLRASGTWYHCGGWYYEPWQGHHLELVLGQLADFEEETLAFTPEELLQRANEILDLRRWYNDGEFQTIPDHYQLYLTTGYNSYVGFNQNNEIKNYEALTMVPLYSDDGGATAMVVSYGAVNANTLQPENAFFVLDFIFSNTSQRRSQVFNPVVFLASMPVDATVGLERVSNIRGWGFSEANFEEYCRVREQITNVQFQSLLTQELDDFYGKLQMAETNGQDPAQLAAEAYAAMERALKE